MTLFYFERMKRKKSQKTIFFFILSILLVVLLFTFNYFMNQQDNEGIKETTRIETDILVQDKYNQETKEYLQEVNAFIQTQEEGWIADAAKGIDLTEELTLPTYPPYRTKINNELIRRKLPVYSLRYGTKNSVFLVILVTYLASFVGILLLLLIFGDSLSGEIEQNTLNFLFVQPVSRLRLFLTKYVISLFQSSLFIGFLLLFGFTMATIFSGMSSFSYPIIVFTKTSMKLIPISQYLFQVALLFIFLLAFVFACHFVVSILCKKVFLSLFVTLFILIEGYIIGTINHPVMNKIAHLNPFVYLNVGKIFVGYDFRDYFQYTVENQEYYGNYCLPRILHNEQLQFGNGLMVLGIATLFTLWFGYILLKKNGHCWSIK